MIREDADDDDIQLRLYPVVDGDGNIQLRVFPDELIERAMRSDVPTLFRPPLFPKYRGTDRCEPT